jgi:peroxiredoxin
MIFLSFPLWGGNLRAVSIEQYHEITLGDKAPDFTLTEITSKESFSLSDLTGKVVLLELFTRWNESYIEALPSIREIAYSYFDLIVISVDISISQDEFYLQRFKDEHSMSWKVALDTNGIIASNYGSETVPSWYIINQTGYVEYKRRAFFDYELVAQVLSSLLTPVATVVDITKPQIINAQIEPISTPISFLRNEIQITCDNVSDDFAVKSVFAEVFSPSNEVKEYPLIQTSNGSIDQIISIDPKLLYQQSTVQIAIVAVDYKENKQETLGKEINVETTEIDTEIPSIISIEVNYTLLNNRYYFTVKTQVTDDLFVYKIIVEVSPQAWDPKYGQWYQKYGFYLDDMKRIPDEENFLVGTKIIHEMHIEDPNRLFLEVRVEDIGGNIVTLWYDPSDTRWQMMLDSLGLLIILLFLICLVIVISSVIFFSGNIKAK